MWRGVEEKKREGEKVTGYKCQVNTAFKLTQWISVSYYNPQDKKKNINNHFIFLKLQANKGVFYLMFTDRMSLFCLWVCLDFLASKHSFSSFPPLCSYLICLDDRFVGYECVTQTHILSACHIIFHVLSFCFSSL